MGAGMEQGPTRRWEIGATLTVHHDLGAVAFVTDDELDIAVPPEVGDSWRAIRHLLFSGLSWWFERRDHVLLHGAMIARGGEGALILGATGRGKSTAAFAAWRSGWDLCSDDLVIVGLREGRLHGFGIPKRPSIEMAIAEGIEHSCEDERARVMLDGDALTTGWKSLHSLVVVDHHDGGGTMEPLGHADALGAVLAACLEAERPDAVARQLRTLVAVAGLPAFELLHAADRTARVQRAAELIDEMWTVIRGSRSQ